MASLKGVDESVIPPGFIYIQLPGEKSPQELWPKVAPWLDISPSFAGTFFRVNGGGAEPFGKVQEEFIPHISQLNYTNIYIFDEKPETSILMNFQMSDESSSLLISYSEAETVKNGFNAIKFKWTTGEVRPKNMAIKIWRRMI